MRGRRRRRRSGRPADNVPGIATGAGVERGAVVAVGATVAGQVAIFFGGGRWSKVRGLHRTARVIVQVGQRGVRVVVVVVFLEQHRCRTRDIARRRGVANPRAPGQVGRRSECRERVVEQTSGWFGASYF